MLSDIALGPLNERLSSHRIQYSARDPEDKRSFAIELRYHYAHCYVYRNPASASIATALSDSGALSPSFRPNSVV